MIFESKTPAQSMGGDHERAVAPSSPGGRTHDPAPHAGTRARWAGEQLQNGIRPNGLMDQAELSSAMRDLRSSVDNLNSSLAGIFDKLNDIELWLEHIVEKRS